jgi:hypothetical protein
MFAGPGELCSQAATDTQDYFFFAINPDQTVTAFRSQFETHDLAGLRTNQEQLGDGRCS